MRPQLTYCDVCKTSNVEVNFTLMSMSDGQWIRVCSDCFIRLLERFGNKAKSVCLGNLDLNESLEPVMREFVEELTESNLG